MTSAESIDQIVLQFCRNDLCGALHICTDKGQSILHGTILIRKGLPPFLHSFFKCRHIFFRESKHHFGLTRNGIAHVAALPFSQTGFKVGNSILHKACHHLVGIAAALVNFKSRMAAK